uniref:Vacuolar ATPase assembly protein VMA22 n=1 Tax=Kalanchoe fedtschenkoi TaxID=63787 RepID=A0A7N0U2X1_KALFE
MELASARHSMGTSRISCALFDLKSHSAATTLQLGHSNENQPHFGLHKWGSHETGAKELNDDERYKKDDAPQLRRRGSAEVAVAQDSNKCELSTVDPQVQKERAKSLSVFGTLVSPKLRSAQLTFETALETLVRVANMRSSLLHAADNVRKEMECSSQ